MASVNVNIDDSTYEHALALFAFRGMSAEEAVKELFERAAYDEYPTYNHLKFNAETEQAIKEAEQGINLLGPFNTMKEFWTAMELEDDDAKAED